MKKINKIIIIFIILMFSFGKTTYSVAENPVKVSFIGLDNINSVLIKGHNSNVLIDTGDYDDINVLEKYFKGEGIDSLDLIIITSCNSKYYGGLKKLLDDVKVKHVIIPKYFIDCESNLELQETLKSKSVQFTPVSSGFIYNHETINLEVISPSEKSFKDKDNTLAIKGIIDEVSYLFLNNVSNNTIKNIINSKETQEAKVINISADEELEGIYKKLMKRARPFDIIVGENINNYSKVNFKNAVGKRYNTYFFKDFKVVTVNRQLGNKSLKTILNNNF
ncbi:Metallo-beta-lactamase superfamily protein [Clostridium cavendishii DSM 21758]|uniref:Metallo-beta-lactamase superfamily protein n=1 Tax=Clostridium cavendishii DSM 21758 TaxID=1121302 RepID=A0A1M6FI26_9CLOT|nr:MBL fold metallo-hydrolase [Clostridium cavendishii]SHI97289.1 Metallo-beta-lactamase superfamily protein [Clostridium cavendishii DSM 21758]